MRRAGLAAVLIATADLALLGSLFALAAAVAAEQTGNQVYLAAPEAAEAGVPPRAVIVDVAADRSYRLGAQRLTRTALARAIRAPLAGLPEPIVAVRPAPGADWDDIAHLLRVAREAGASRVELLGSAP